MRGASCGFVLGVVACVGCGTRSASPPTKIDVLVPEPIAPSALPKSPIDLKEPAAPSAEMDGKDVSKLTARELSALAARATNRRDYKSAAAAEYWAVKAGGGDPYKLARLHGRLNEVDASLYWLIEAATKKGIDLYRAADENDLASVRADPRYPDRVFPFLANCAAYFKAHGPPTTLVFVPKGFDASKPTPAIVYLHDRAGRPDDFFGPDTQALADATGLPVVGVSGTIPLGPKAFVWAVDPTPDAKRIADALKDAKDKLTLAPGRAIALGFSEGAQVAFDLAVRDPATFAGAIALSPAADFKLDDVKSPPNASRFVITMGSKETWNREVVKRDREFLTAAKLPFMFVDIPDGEHSLPPDVLTRLPQWVAFVLSGK